MITTKEARELADAADDSGRNHHEFARRVGSTLRNLADQLDARPAVKLPQRYIFDHSIEDLVEEEDGDLILVYEMEAALKAAGVTVQE